MIGEYDPFQAPDPQAWLALDEGERIDLVTEWHEASGDPLPEAGDWVAHAVIHVIVKNQAAENHYGVRDILERLMDEGLNRHDAVHAVGSVLARHVYDVMAGGGGSRMDQDAYAREVAALTATEWLASGQPGPEAATVDEPGSGGLVEPFSDHHGAILEAFLDGRGEGELGYFETAGFLYAVLCSPEFIMPSEWQHQVLGETVFEDDGQAGETIGALMSLYNWISERIREEESPLPPGCEPDPEPMANLGPETPFGRWSRGFGIGHAWSEQSWSPLVARTGLDEEVGAAVVPLAILQSRQMAEAVHAENPGDHSFEEFVGLMHRLIPEAIDTYASLGMELRERRETLLRTPARSHKIGRNEFCPCGSGKKYKKCCGRDA